MNQIFDKHPDQWGLRGDPSLWANDLSKEFFTTCHVLFQKDDAATYIRKLLETAASDQ